MTRLHPDDLEEGMEVRLAWSPKGTGEARRGAEGEVVRVRRSGGEVEEFAVESDGFVVNVYADYRDPPVEIVDDEVQTDAETVGRLDELARAVE